MNKTTKIIIWLIVAIIIIAGIWWGVGRKLVQPPTAEKEEVIKVGILTHQTGFGSIWGEGEMKAAVMAVKELQKEGVKIDYFIEDCMSEKNKCLNAAHKLIEVSGVDLIVGPTWDEWFEVVAPLAQMNHVILISPSGSSTGLIGKYVFSLKYSNKAIALAILNFLKEKSVKNAALVTSQEAYFMNIKNEFKNVDAGNIIQTFSEISPSERDFKTLFLQLKDYDAIILNINNPQYPTAIKSLKEMGYKGLIVITSNIEKSGDVYKGVYYPDFNINPEFVEKYGLHSPSAPMAYDAVNLYYEAYKNVGKKDPALIASYLEKIIYKGYSGVIKFNKFHQADWGSDVYCINKFD